MSRLNLLLWTAAYLATVTATAAQNRILVITSHESLSAVYVDEVKHPLPNANQRNATDNVLVLAESRLIAVQAVSTIDVCAGFIGSVTNNYLVTDGSWKCSEFGADNWFELGFDDSSWPNAFVVGRNGNVPACSGLKECNSNISPLANWIWTQQDTLTVNLRSGADLLVDRTVFCRGYLPFCENYSPCMNGGTCLGNKKTLCACLPAWTGRYCEKVYVATNRHLTITVKSTLYDLYIDGVRQTNLTNANNWTIPDEVALNSTNRLIALMAVDSSEKCAGVIGSVTDDYLVTNVDWKCNYFTEPQWYRLGSEDDSWPSAYPVGPNDNVTWPVVCQEELSGISSISPNAYWIWTDSIQNTPGYHQTIYCRGYLPTCERDSPCFNGGTCNRNNETLCTCLVGFIGVYCETVDLKNVSLTAKETLYAAYIDGRPISLQNGSDWRKTDSLLVNSTSRLLAVMAIQLEDTCPGILGSVTDSTGDYVLTNATWKCSSNATVGWEELGYDDSAWQPPALIRKNDYTNDTQCNNEPSDIPSISPDAYWIWTKI